MNELQQIIQRSAMQYSIARSLKRISETRDLVFSSGEFVLRVRADCERMVEELLAGEFSTVKDNISIILCKGPEDKFNAEIHWIMKNSFVILVHLKSWAWDPNFTERRTGLRDLMRHELLHLEMKMGDEDPAFKAELKRRDL